MTTLSTKEQCLKVLDTLKEMYADKPYFKSVSLETDDAGLHVVFRVRRSELPDGAIPKSPSMDLVRVCVVVHG
jgi:hypothetical protein